VVRKYCDLIKREGDFAYVCALPVMKPDSDAFNFYLIYATRHAKGVEVFKSVEKRTEERTHVVRADVQKRQRQERGDSFDLFEPTVLYRERKTFDNSAFHSRSFTSTVGSLATER